LVIVSTPYPPETIRNDRQDPDAKLVPVRGGAQVKSRVEYGRGVSRSTDLESAVWWFATIQDPVIVGLTIHIR
jgi:hypothetical protein